MTSVKLVYGKAGTSRRPSFERPLCMARQKCDAVQPPMPVFTSGVMLEPNTVPNGVSIARPPAYGAPPRIVWQAMQLPARARYAPRATCSGVAWNAVALVERRLVAQVERGDERDRREQRDGGPGEPGQRALHRQRSPLPHSSGSGRSGCAAGFAPAGTGREASQTATARTSSADSRFAMAAMQSGAVACRLSVFHAPSWPIT